MEHKIQKQLHQRTKRSVIERQVTRIRSLSTWSHTHMLRDTLAPPPHPITTDPVLSRTLWPEGQAVVRWAGGRAVSSPSGSQELAGGNRWPWGVTYHGTRAKAHTCTQPSAHPHRSRTLAPSVGTAGQLLGTAGLESGTAGAPTLCYYARPHTSEFFEKTSESNLDDSGQPVWDLGFV